MPNTTQAQDVETQLLERARMRAFSMPIGVCAAPLLGVPPDVLRAAIARAVVRVVARAVESGWRPTDLAQIRARRLSGAAGLCLMDVLADVTAAAGHLRSDPTWTAELREVTAADPAAAPRPRLTDPTRDAGWPVAAVLDTALELAGALVLLPALANATPPADDARPGGAEAAMLIKVRALLAKAERTEFEHEAEAFTAKAQALMARHSIDEAVLAADGSGRRADTAVQRIWLDAPYVRAKFSVVSAVATANGCQALLNTGLDVATVVGMRHDVRATVLLATSLQLQVTRAVARVRPDDADGWASSVKTYRRSFLFAFAARIGERLRESTASAQAHVDSDRLLPVLVDRQAAVDRAVAEAFPRTTTLRSTATLDPSGWAAGRAAADLAELGVAPTLRGTG